MKKSLLLALVIAAFSAVSGFAAEPTNLSNDNLAALGLGGLDVVSDAQGEQVRGMGFSFTGGNGFAAGLVPFGGFSTNNYLSGGLLTSNGFNGSRSGVGLGFGLGVTPLFGFGAGFGFGQFGSGGSSGFGF